MAYSINERAKVAAWFEWTRSVTAVQTKFRAEFGRNRQIPSDKTIHKWHQNLMETGSINDPSRKRSHRMSSDENVERVIDHFENDQHSSLRRAANSLAISQTTIHRILKDLKWHPYKVQILQRISDEDKANRLQFAQDELDRIAQNPLHLASLLFSDEAHFHLDGGVNRHNHRYWAPENPSWVLEESLHSPKTTVWAAIGQSGIIGPFFFDETINSQRYLAMLQTQFYPEVIARGLQNDLIFMQDGAPPHWGRLVRDWLNEVFPNRWIGRGSATMPWPPRSPDLTPCDFFLWGFIKSKVYTNRPYTVNELKQRIIHAFNDVTVEMRIKTLLGYQERLNQIIQNDGAHIEVYNS